MFQAIGSFFNQFQNLDFLTNFFNTYGYFSITFLEMLEGIGIPLPGETALVAASIYAANTKNFSIILVIIFATMGTIIGDNIGYWVGRKYGLNIIRKHGHIFRINEKHLKHANKYFQRHGDKTVFIGRFIAFLRMFASFLAGVNEMEYKKFVIYNALGGICWSTCYATLGFLLGKNLPLLFRIIRNLSIIGTIAIVLIVIVIAFVLIRDRND